ncbi:PREDICTED: uncharacterized protein LOC106117028 [Papilio xuthus]|uniref:Uncharacterized protein LOC106117028 n=1 Tax=Papilio xuthus TaxID=66420 RepID=A0AAJ6Z707_PAPXU|nr:PREDICTED: uncharacterized protein LOC106117028 [Papilio xuthus]
MDKGDVSPLNNCQTKEAKRLYIYDIGTKLNTPGQYDIGGTYTEDESDLWFFCSTSLCPGYQYLLNVFVCHRKPGIISVGITKSNKLTYKVNIGTVTNNVLSGSLSWQTLRAVESDEINYIKTFCFTEMDTVRMKYETLIIYLSIECEPKCLVSDNVINRVKLNHDFGELLSNESSKDFELKTPSGKVYKIHKLVLIAQSPVLRKTLKNLNEKSLLLDICDDDLELLLQFFYTGTINNVSEENCIQLLEMAGRFELRSLFLFMQDVVKKQTTIDNAIDIAIISERYKLEDMQKYIFQFIKEHPQVLNTESWKNLNDIKLTKKLLENIYTNRI